MGKSTLFETLCRKLEAPEIKTFAKKGEGVYLQYENATVQVGVYDEALPGHENKMRPVAEGFAAGCRVLKALSQAQQPWVAVDEIGYLEPEAYQAELLDLLEKKQVLAVVRKQDTTFLNALLARQDALVVDLDGYDLGCVIMASGLGTRFGGNKLMAPLGGKPVVAWAIDGAKDVFSKVVVVTRHEDVAKIAAEKGVSVVLHDLLYRSDTVRLGLQNMGEISGCLFWPGDQPFVMKESLYAMALCAANCHGIWKLGGRSPVLFPKWAFEELKTLPQGKGGNVLAQKYEDQVASVEEASSWELRDIDTPQDLSCFCAGICCN